MGHVLTGGQEHKVGKQYGIQIPHPGLDHSLPDFLAECVTWGNELLLQAKRVRPSAIDTELVGSLSPLPKCYFN